MLFETDERQVRPFAVRLPQPGMQQCCALLQMLGNQRTQAIMNSSPKWCGNVWVWQIAREQLCVS